MQQLKNEPHVGLSLVNYAPVAVLVNILIAGLANALLELNITTLIYALVGGGFCGASLLAYWLGKGGVFFVVGVSIPLLVVLLTPLTNLAALINLVSGFFLGFFILLVGFKLLSKVKKT
ncbi:hypothetical protein J8L70_07050 [Pseudoalteromonas sp. MMG010]|uniref:hypothetical protein n=1 Tax=Pseudoalteromonas sp. MMG010 TaxID=2822685 RepID=UPI001B39F3A8|nr:hypothetical protein [Pseudoalteromonas sp. MMG010]MBQ4832991.1 hypothetical protein [Pseudoalteromonas sp. MMG010]